MTDELVKYRVSMQTKPGMFAQYDGYVDIYSATDNPVDIQLAAVKELKRSAFPDYSSDMWKMTRFERLT